MSHRWGANRPPTISAAQRKRILTRDRHRCYVCKKPGANQVDHITPRHLDGTNTDNNLAAIHERPCHLNKTLAEAQAARQLAPRKRTPPKHPGLAVAAAGEGDENSGPTPPDESEPLAVWIAFAATINVATLGLTKAQIIVAVQAHLAA